MINASSVDPYDYPRDCKLISILLQQQSADAEKGCVPMLYEFMHHYITDILTDAHTLTDHAGLKEITPDCIRLAIDARVGHAFTSPPDVSVMQELALKRNRAPLPVVGTHI
jgi:Transcription initiation factor IID, 31kD subunit